MLFRSINVAVTVTSISWDDSALTFIGERLGWYVSVLYLLSMVIPLTVFPSRSTIGLVLAANGRTVEFQVNY